MLSASQENTLHMAPGDGEKVNVGIWGLGHAGIGQLLDPTTQCHPLPNMYFSHRGIEVKNDI